MAGLLSVRRRAGPRLRSGRRRRAAPVSAHRARAPARKPARTYPEPRPDLDADPAREPAPRPVRALLETPFVRGDSPVRRAPHVLLVCGRAPGRALSSGCFGRASMVAAWVGPLHWTQWAGGHCRLIPRRRRTGPGGERHLPDCASKPVRGRCGAARARVHGRGRARRPPDGDRRRTMGDSGRDSGGSWGEVGRKWTSDATSCLASGFNALQEWPDVVGPPRLGPAIHGHPVDPSTVVRRRAVGDPGCGRISAGGSCSSGEGNAPGTQARWGMTHLARAVSRVSRRRPAAESLSDAAASAPAGARPGPAFARGACPSDVRRP